MQLIMAAVYLWVLFGTIQWDVVCGVQLRQILYYYVINVITFITLLILFNTQMLDIYEYIDVETL